MYHLNVHAWMHLLFAKVWILLKMAFNKSRNINSARMIPDPFFLCQNSMIIHRPSLDHYIDNQQSTYLASSQNGIFHPGCATLMISRHLGQFKRKCPLMQYTGHGEQLLCDIYRVIFSVKRIDLFGILYGIYPRITVRLLKLFMIGFI